MMGGERKTQREVSRQHSQDELEDKENEKEDNVIKSLLNSSLTIRDILEQSNIATDGNPSSYVLTQQDALRPIYAANENLEVRDVSLTSARNCDLAIRGSLISENELPTDESREIEKEESERIQFCDLHSPPIDESHSCANSALDKPLLERDRNCNCHLDPQENNDVQNLSSMLTETLILSEVQCNLGIQIDEPLSINSSGAKSLVENNVNYNCHLDQEELTKTVSHVYDVKHLEDSHVPAEPNKTLKLPEAKSNASISVLPPADESLSAKSLFGKKHGENDHRNLENNKTPPVSVISASNINRSEVQFSSNNLPLSSTQESDCANLTVDKTPAEKIANYDSHLTPLENSKTSPPVYDVEHLDVSPVPAKSFGSSKHLEVKCNTNILSLPSRNVIPLHRSDTQHFESVVIKDCENTVFGTKISTEELTINQYVNLSKLSNGISPGIIMKTDSSGNENCCIKFRYLWATLLLTIIITAAVSVPSLIFLKSESLHENNVAEIVSNEEIDVPANYTLRLIPWSQWTNVPQAKLRPLTIQPARYTVVCHTASSFCNTSPTCTNSVKNIESWHLQIGLSTAWYNFMIGGDGFIYEGRGWDKEGEHSPSLNCASIGVAFLGNFDINHLSPIMIESYNLLMEEGVRRGALIKDYKMVGQNQVKNTSSPGLNIKKVLKTWAHWGSLKKEDFCSN